MIYDETSEYSMAIEDWTYMINYFQDSWIVKMGDAHLRRGKAYLYTNQKELACKDFHESLNGNFRLQNGKEFIKKYCDQFINEKTIKLNSHLIYYQLQ